MIECGGVIYFNFRTYCCCCLGPGYLKLYMFSALIFLTATMNGMTRFVSQWVIKIYVLMCKRLRWLVDGKYQCSTVLYIVLWVASDRQCWYWHCLCHLPGKIPRRILCLQSNRRLTETSDRSNGWRPVHLARRLARPQAGHLHRLPRRYRRHDCRLHRKNHPRFHRRSILTLVLRHLRYDRRAPLLHRDRAAAVSGHHLRSVQHDLVYGQHHRHLRRLRRASEPRGRG